MEERKTDSMNVSCCKMIRTRLINKFVFLMIDFVNMLEGSSDRCTITFLKPRAIWLKNAATINFTNRNFYLSVFYLLHANTSRLPIHD